MHDPAVRAFVQSNLPDFTDSTWEISPAGSAASQRTFLRCAEKTGARRSFIIMQWDARDEEWSRFLSIQTELSNKVPFLPRIFAADPARGLILEEDLGVWTLKRHLDAAAGDRATLRGAYRLVLDALAKWQSVDAAASPTIASRRMDEATFMWESGYFAEHCAGGLCECGSLLDAAWEGDRLRCAKAAAGLPQTFLHRDFQSENILLREGNIRFVDFQGARLGPPGYDAASLLLDPYVAALDDAAADLFEYYSALPMRVVVDPHAYFLCAAQRLMQALGAYGNLSLHKGKARYRQFVPLALARLQAVMKNLPEYRAMTAVVEACALAIA
jgi:aminoglycoside/choline kinase family phosphotransferase